MILSIQNKPQKLLNQTLKLHKNEKKKTHYIIKIYVKILKLIKIKKCYMNKKIRIKIRIKMIKINHKVKFNCLMMNLKKMKMIFKLILKIVMKMITII